MKALLTYCLAAVAACAVASPADARLGDTRVTAEKHMRTYGAHVPTVVLDSKGKVIRERWAAPPEMWTLAEGFKMRDILIGHAKPVKKEEDGLFLRFTYKSGVTVDVARFNGKVTEVIAYAKGYDRQNSHKYNLIWIEESKWKK